MRKNKTDPIRVLDAQLVCVQRKTVAHVEKRILDGATIVSSVGGQVVEHKRKSYATA